MAELRSRAQFSGSAIEVALTILQRPALAVNGYSSVFIDRQGVVYLLEPHTHDVTAQAVLAALGETELPPHLHYFAQRLVQRSGGIVHGSAYENGAGAIIDLDYPPTQAQINALRTLFDTTSREEFTADLYHNGQLVGPQTSIPSLIRAINAANRGDPLF